MTFVRLNVPVSAGFLDNLFTFVLGIVCLRFTPRMSCLFCACRWILYQSQTTLPWPFVRELVCHLRSISVYELERNVEHFLCGAPSPLNLVVGQRARTRRAGEGKCTGIWKKGGRKVGSLRWREAGDIGKITQHCVVFRNLKRAVRW